MKHSNRIYNLVIAVLTFILVSLLILAFYLLFFYRKQKIIASIDNLDIEVSINSNKDLIQKIKNEFLEQNAPVLLVSFEERIYRFDSKDIVNNIFIEKLDTNTNSNTINFVNSIFTKPEKTTINAYLDFNVEYIFSKIPYKITYKENNSDLLTYISISNNFVENCDSKNIKINKSKHEINLTIQESIIKNKILNLIELFSPQEKFLFEACKNLYWNKISNFKNIFQTNFPNLNFEEIFKITINNNQAYWDIYETKKLDEYLNSLSEKINQKLYEGTYEIKDNKIFLYTPYKIGKILNIHKTKDNIIEWLNGKQSYPSIVIDQIIPDVLNKKIPILDFTVELAEGKTRLHKVRNNLGNEIFYAVQGLMEVDGLVVYPNQTFSYIQHIKPNNGLTINNRAIGGGICNATTTLYRAALEAGLPIVERYPHYRNFQSYSWGYPLNLVDAAYFTDPQVDLKFTNDYTDPILFRVIISQDNEYQYHTIKVLGSQNIKRRKVEFKNWTQYNPNNPSGYFERFVYDFNTNELIRSERIESHYSY